MKLILRAHNFFDIQSLIIENVMILFKYVLISRLPITVLYLGYQSGVHSDLVDRQFTDNSIGPLSNNST